MMLHGKSSIYCMTPLSKNISLQIQCIEMMLKENDRGFPGGAVVENPPANAGDTGSIPGLGRSHMPQSN